MRLRPTEAPRALSPALAAAKRAERRRGAWTVTFGLVAATVALAMGVHGGLRGHERPQLSTGLLFLAGIALYGTGLHQVLWAPTSDPDGIPPKVRPWVTALLCLFTWWLLATAAGLIAAVVKERALGG